MSEKPKNLPPMPEGKEIPMSGTFKKWEHLGEIITGKILKIEISRKYKGENHVAVLRTDDNERIAVSAPLKLREAIVDFDLIGKRVAIQYVGTTTVKGGELKEFRVVELEELPGDNEEDLPY